MGSGQSAQAKKPIVVIAGGGYGGVTAAKLLDATGDFFVILIDRKNYFLHNVGALRASLDTNTAKQIMIPYNNLLKNGIVLQADIDEIRTHEVRVHGRQEGIKFDYLIIATGSSYAFPGKVAEPNILDAYLKYESFNNRVRNAGVKNIVVVGGGAVGIELAAELKEFLPTTNVTLVHSTNTLIHNEPLKQEFLQGVDRQLAKLGVNVELNQRIPYPQNYGANVEVGGSGAYFFGLGSVTTSKDKHLPADLLLFTTGARTNTKSLYPAFANVIVNDRLTINAHQQVQGYDAIFAVGDIAGTHTKRAMYAGSQAEIAAKNIILLNKNALKANPSPAPKLESWSAPAGHPLILTIGSRAGMSQFFNKGESVWGSKVTTMIKSKGLFSEKYWGELNQKDAYALLTKNAGIKTLQPEQIQFDVDSVKHQKQIELAMNALNLNGSEVKVVLKQGLPHAQLEPNQQFV